jgi:hypothetical protein
VAQQGLDDGQPSGHGGGPERGHGVAHPLVGHVKEASLNESQKKQ